MNPNEKAEARRHAMARQREREKFWERHDRLHPTDIPSELHDSPCSTEAASEPVTPPQ